MVSPLSENNEAILASLVPEDPLVPLSFFKLWLSGRVDPETGKPSESHQYDERGQKLLLRLADHKNTKIAGLPQTQQKLWLSAAGGPGSGKSTAFLRWISKLWDVDVAETAWGKPNLASTIKTIFNKAPLAWVSPDRGGLVAIGEELWAPFDQGHYLKWRWGSNFLSNLTMVLAYATGKNIAHDTTLGSLRALENLQKARDAAYYVAVFAVGAPLETRAKAASLRNAHFFQSLPSNVVEQDRVFGENLPGIIRVASEVTFAWREEIHEPAHVVAFIQGNTLSVCDDEKFQKFCDLYPAMREVVRSCVRDDRITSNVPLFIEKQRKPAAKMRPSRRTASPQGRAPS